MKNDPFSIHGAAEYQFIEFSPMKYDERFFMLYQKGLTGIKNIRYDQERRQSNIPASGLVDFCIS